MNLETKSNKDIIDQIVTLHPQKRKEVERSARDILNNRHSCIFYGLDYLNPNMRDAIIISYREIYSGKTN
jgi:hypothetical protein